MRERPSSPATVTQQHTCKPNPLYRLGSYDPSAPDTQGTISDATSSPHPFSSADAADASDAPGPASGSTAEAQAAGSRCQHCRAHSTAHLAHALVEANASVTAARTQLLAAQADIALLLGERKRVNRHPSLLCAAVCCQPVKLLTQTHLCFRCG